MTSCFNIHSATADMVTLLKFVEGNHAWICGHEDDLIQDV